MFKDFLVQIDDSAPCRERLKVSLNLAQRFDARLTGLFAQLDPKRRSLVGGGPSDDFEKARQSAQQAFETTAKKTGVETRWMEILETKRSQVTQEFVHCARFYDLSILAQPEPDGDGHLPQELPEEVLMHSGGPALVVPYAGSFETISKKVLLAWNGSAEAARAVRDALPLLRLAEEVVVIVLSDPAEIQGCKIAPGILDHLRASGVNCRSEVFTPGDTHTMDILLSTAADEDCDLIVMGAFGHYGFPKFHRGGGTRYMLQHNTVPVFMAH